MASSNIFAKVVSEKARAAISIKFIAVVLSLIASIWLIIAVAGERWVIVTFEYFGDQTWDWGLWKTCHTVVRDFVVCVEADWLGACLVLSTISLTFSVCSTLSGLYAIRFATTEIRRNTCFAAATVFLLLVVFLEFIVVVIYPVKFRQDITKTESVKRWDFDWSYGFAWGGLIFSLAAAMFFFVSGKYKTLPNKSDTDGPACDSFE